MPHDVFRRHPTNPILTADDWPTRVNAVFNPGATMFDGETLLLVRVEDRSGVSRFCVARSRDGVSDWTIEDDRGLRPETASVAEHWGIEDPRITRCEEDYLIAYTGYSLGGPLVCLASTQDFVSFQRRGIVLAPENKDAALFPVRFSGGRWAMIHRPVPQIAGMGAHIWVSFSPDLRHWGATQMLLAAERGSRWDAGKIGLGPPPLETDEGWLLCYHGVKATVAGPIYRIGLALLDRHDPVKVLRRSEEWVMSPKATYECDGDVPNVVFPCGWVLDGDGDTVRLYYGAADSCIALATASLRELLAIVDAGAAVESRQPQDPELLVGHPLLRPTEIARP